jgi:hypothetical protein
MTERQNILKIEHNLDHFTEAHLTFINTGENPKYLGVTFKITIYLWGI